MTHFRLIVDTLDFRGLHFTNELGISRQLQIIPELGTTVLEDV